MIWVYLLIAIGVVSGAFFAVQSYTSAIEDAKAQSARAEKAESALASSELAIEKLREMGRLSDGLNRSAKQAEQKERDRADSFEQRLAAINAATNPAVVAWRDSPVPDSVRRMRRADQGVRDGGALPVADSTPRPNAGASDERRDERSAPP